MKRNILVILMLTLVCVTSCNKSAIEGGINENNPVLEEETLRIKAIIDNGTFKSEPLDDGTTTSVAFLVDDEIWFSNGESTVKGTVLTVDKSKTPAEATVAVKAKAAFFEGKTVYAVYPYSAAPSSAAIDNGQISVTIPNIQDGSFANANISVAKTEVTSVESMGFRFRNATAIMQITNLPEGVNKVEVLTSPEGIAGAGETIEIAGQALVTVGGTVTATLSNSGRHKKITVNPVGGSFTNNECYIALFSANGKKNMPIRIYKPGNASVDGSVTGKYFKSDQLFEVSKCYKVDMSNVKPFRDFIQIGNVKWATCNVGASAPEKYGDYYAWGETETHYNPGWVPETEKWYLRPDYQSEIPVEDFNIYQYWKDIKGNKGYRDVNYKYYVSKNTYSKYTNEKGTASVLEMDDDAAHTLWGIDWRCPSSANAKNLLNRLINYPRPTYDGEQHLGVSNFRGDSGKNIQIPIGGFLLNLQYRSYSSACYWLRELNGPNTEWPVDNARSITFFPEPKWESATRTQGSMIRPVLEDPE